MTDWLTYTSTRIHLWIPLAERALTLSLGFRKACSCEQVCICSVSGWHIRFEVKCFFLSFSFQHLPFLSKLHVYISVSPCLLAGTDTHDCYMNSRQEKKQNGFLLFVCVSLFLYQHHHLWKYFYCDAWFWTTRAQLRHSEA